MGKFDQQWKDVFDGAEMAPSENVWQAIDSKLWLNENTGFDNGWKKLFQNAELMPANSVWKGIEASLMSSENSTMRKRILIYQRIAAVSIGMLIMFGAYSWFLKSSNTPRELITENSLTQKLNNNKVAEQPSSSNLSDNNSGNTTTEGSQPNNHNNSSSVNKVNGHDSPPNYSFRITETQQDPQSQTGILNEEKSPAESGDLIAGNIKRRYQFKEGPLSDLRLIHISKLPHSFKPNDYAIAYRLADARPAVMIKKKREPIRENSFAALSFAAGSFSPGVGSTPVLDVATRSSYTMAADKGGNTPNVRHENIKSGTSFAMAISAGKRIFKRFILQGGVSYFNQNSSSTGEIVNVAPANEVVEVNSFKPETTNSVTYQSQQDINSTFQFISVPVQLGYMVVDRKFGVQINGGIAPDFFLGNSIYNESTQVEMNNTAGENGAFNKVSLAGLGSIEFSYKFFSHYRLSLAPGIKYSLTSIYNENTFASARPLVADVGLRFRYIF